MAAGIVVEVKGLTELRAKLAPGLYQSAVARLMSRLAILAERTARQEAPKDTGALARSILSTVQPMQATVYSTLSYAAAMEEGRAPGARMPPPDALAGWARRHGFTGSLFVLARSIGKKGIKGRHFFAKAALAVERELPAQIAATAREVAAKWAG